MLALFATSGNSLVTEVFARVTGISASAVFQNASFSLLARSVTTTNGVVQAIPYARQPALLKTHYPGNARNVSAAHREHKYKQIDKVIRLARNPGDQMLRNIYRWAYRRHSRDTQLGGYDRFVSAHGNSSLCREVANPRVLWYYTLFHQFWETFNASIPQKIMHFERFADAKTAETEFRAMFGFLEHRVTNLKERLNGIVRPAVYEQGAFLKTVCGLNTTRAVDAATKQVTRRLGYKFDFEAGVWSLPEKY